ncbi:MAG: T9SS type A sorting domain-containing protein [Sphingobacteriales bacterium]|nr:T9SS type A sorting domain-containing protein [Sphingobacteriales bacterium]
MKKVISYTLTAVMIFFNTLSAQNDTLSYFKKTYPNDSIATFNGGAVETDDAYIIVTNQAYYYTNEREIILRSIDKHSGTTLDTKSLGTNMIGEYVSFTGKEVLLEDEDIVVMALKCYEYDGTNCLRNTKLLRTNKEGDIIWEKEYGTAGGEISGMQIKGTKDGGYIIGGLRFIYGDSIEADNDPYLIKLDSLGEVEWERVYPTTIIGAALYVYPTQDGGYIFSGYRGKGGNLVPAYQNCYVTRVDSVGNVIWDKVYQEDTESVLNTGGKAIPIPNTNNYLLSYTYGKDNKRYQLVGAIDDTGEVLWEKHYHYPNYTTTFFTEVYFQPDGGFVSVAHQANDIPRTEALVMRFNSTGDTLWTKRIGIESSENQYTRGFLATSDGGYLLTGLSFEGNYAWEVKIDSLGNTCWQTGCDSMYVEVVGIDEIGAQEGVSISPNPATDKLFIHSHEAITSVEIYNTLGQQFPLLEGARGSTNSPSERGQGGVNEAQFGAENELSVAHLTSGIYFVQAHTKSGKVFTQKFVKR